MKIRYVPVLFVLLLLWSGNVAAADAAHRTPPVGLKNAKAFFDVNLGSAAMLPRYLQVIEQTYASLKNQGANPNFVVAFRGPAVTLITRGGLPEVAVLMERLAASGIRFEACTIAMGLFSIEGASLLPQVQVVENTFISAISYGSRGYISIPIQ